MEKSKFVARYVGSMGGIATFQAVAAFYLIARPQNVYEVSNAAAKLLPFLEKMPKAAPTFWFSLGGAFLIVQSASYLCAALFPKRWPYRALCFCSSAVATGALAYLYSRDLRLAPLLAGALWQGVFGLWVAWLLAVEIVQRPFSPPPASRSASAAPSPAQ